MLVPLVVVSEVYAWPAMVKGSVHGLLPHFDSFNDPGVRQQRPMPATPGTPRSCFSKVQGTGTIPPQYVDALLAHAHVPQAQPQTGFAGVRGSAWSWVALSAQRWRLGPVCNTGPAQSQVEQELALASTPGGLPSCPSPVLCHPWGRWVAGPGAGELRCPILMSAPTYPQLPQPPLGVRPAKPWRLWHLVPIAP